jgi:hypothetical protein
MNEVYLNEYKSTRIFCQLVALELQAQIKHKKRTNGMGGGE